MSAGGRRWPQQVLDQRLDCAAPARAEPLPLCTAQRQQPSLPGAQYVYEEFYMRSSISASPKSPTVYSRETWLPPAPLPSVSASRFCLRFCLPFLCLPFLPPVSASRSFASRSFASRSFASRSFASHRCRRLECALPRVRGGERIVRADRAELVFACRVRRDALAVRVCRSCKDGSPKCST